MVSRGWTVLYVVHQGILYILIILQPLRRIVYHQVSILPAFPIIRHSPIAKSELTRTFQLGHPLSADLGVHVSELALPGS